jgi:putative ABC transport system permease protein
MIYNYIAIALRALRKNPVFTTIHLLGLSLGMAAFILIFQYISFEKSVNGFHANLPNLYRVLFEVSYSGKTFTWESVPPTIGPLAKDQFAEVNGYCRVMAGSTNGVVSYQPDQQAEPVTYSEEKIVYADGNFFTVFSFPTVEGDAKGIEKPNTVALSRSLSSKYFSDSNPLGKVITLNNQFGKTLYTVTSVYENFPANSDLQYDMVFSLETLANPANLNGNDWANLESMNSQFIETYLLIKDSKASAALEDKLNDAKKKIRPEAPELIRLQALADMHLPRSLSDYYTTFGSLKFTYILQLIGVLIVAIAWFNYINLSTAGAIKRAKEVGIRKVIGASKAQLIRQFMGESFILNVCAFLLALVLVNLVQPIYNELTQKELTLSLLVQDKFWITGLLLILFGSLASGAYTSFALASFKPSETLKGVFGSSFKGQWLRKSLVVFQFGISIVLIASTFVLYRQLQFMQQTELGVKLDQLVVLGDPKVLTDTTFKSRTLAFKNEIVQQSFVEDLSLSGSVPGTWYNYNTVGFTKTNPQPDDEKINYAVTYIDDRYLSIYEIGIAAGRTFTPEECSNSKEHKKIMMNERAAELLGFESAEQAIGQKILNGEGQFEVTGVVKDYHHQSLQKAIEPVLFFPRYNTHYFTVKISTEQIQGNMSQLESLYKKYFPGNPFEFFFADEKYNQQYKTEQQYGLIFSIASSLAIFIACLGLFGLAAFTVEQRIKEIGVRKVLGASVSQIAILLSKDFIVLVFVAIFIATPLAWYAMSQWLEGFAYRTEITWWIFVGAGAVAILIALITVSSQAIKAAMSNPVESLRSE